MKPTMLLGKNPVVWLGQTLRSKGPVRVFKVMWHAVVDALWDFRHGTDTLKRIAPGELETDSTNKKSATYYGATRARPLIQLLDRLGLPDASVFVDLGSGKGRVLLIAAQYGFRRVVGVDFSEPLCRVARKNLEAFRRSRSITSDVQVVHADVVQYSIQPDETVFFLYDPFSTEVLDKVIGNIRQSLSIHPRKIWVIYNAPRHHDVIVQSGLFGRIQNYEIGGNEFCVYGN
ncbi:MAG: class I SAM-dependent methyltransferase [Opitutaceae bacterium]|nr:class I SAM-dependent methyltransferase [Verrucomicrobiales bacterium]